jgi:4-hydroxyphenylpyruvate dioxygenase
MAPRYRPAIASQSIGRAPHHRIEHKLSLIASHGFEAIELFMEDLELVAEMMRTANSNTDHFIAENLTNEKYLLAAASYIGNLCRHLSLAVLCLQPFANFEGLRSSSEHAARISELELWIRLAQNLGTDLIQIPSSYLPEDQCTDNRDHVIADLREVADIGLQHTPPIRFAHEALCWGTYTDKWWQVWDIVQAVDRPNFGTCLDTFNILGREYADPASPNGLVPDAATALKHTLHLLRTRLDPAKIFYIEACDGERLAEPLVPGHEFYNADQKARMSWSRNARLYPFEERGYLPVTETLKAITDAGYEGYVAFEFFSRTAHEKGEHVAREHAGRAKRSWQRMCQEMGWEDVMESTLEAESPATTTPDVIMTTSDVTAPMAAQTGAVGRMLQKVNPISRSASVRTVSAH